MMKPYDRSLGNQKTRYITDLRKIAHALSAQSESWEWPQRILHQSKIQSPSIPGALGEGVLCQNDGVGKNVYEKKGRKQITSEMFGLRVRFVFLK